MQNSTSMWDSFRKNQEEVERLRKENDRLRKALRDLVDRCDGEEGVRSDGSNIPTFGAHVALGDIIPLLDEIIPVDEIEHRMALQNTAINEFLLKGK